MKSERTRNPGLRELDLERIKSQQIGACDITSAKALIRRLEDLLLESDDMLQEAQRRQDPHWWRYADRRDDLVDVLRAISNAVEFNLKTAPSDKKR